MASWWSRRIERTTEFIKSSATLTRLLYSFNVIIVTSKPKRTTEQKNLRNWKQRKLPPYSRGGGSRHCETKVSPILISPSLYQGYLKTAAFQTSQMVPYDFFRQWDIFLDQKWWSPLFIMRFLGKNPQLFKTSKSPAFKNIKPYGRRRPWPFPVCFFFFKRLRESSQHCFNRK